MKWLKRASVSVGGAVLLGIIGLALRVLGDEEIRRAEAQEMADHARV